MRISVCLRATSGVFATREAGIGLTVAPQAIG